MHKHTIKLHRIEIIISVQGFKPQHLKGLRQHCGMRLITAFCDGCPQIFFPHFAIIMYICRLSYFTKMYTLFLKEIKGFFSSVIGYLVIAVFLLIVGLFMWVFPTNFNIFQVNAANIDTLFLISPWVFLFLVPAITMNMFADELRTGNMELLLTRPISEFKIVTAKYLAAVVLVLIALLPTLLFLFSIHFLADPVGNVDYGAIAGSYIGLFFLGAVYAAVGIFASSLSKNVIVSFLLGIVFCFLFYLGFNLLADLVSTGTVAEFIKSLGINDHYSSISRGVVDSRDIVYFLSVIAIFIFFSKLRLESRKW